MKKYAVFRAILFLSCGAILNARPQEVFSRSYMFTRPVCESLAMNQHLWHDYVYNKKGPIYGAFQAIAYYMHSMPEEKVARYFLFENKNELLVSGDTVISQLFTRDIRAEWLNLPDDFSGRMTICPEQRQAGFSITYDQDLKLLGIEFLHNWSFGIELPVMWVENNINFQQFDMSTSGTQVTLPQTLYAAFNQPTWCYGKISPNAQKAAHAAQLKFTLGRTYLDSDYFQLATFSEVIAPFAPKQNPEYMFSPVVGNNKHWGIGAVVLMQLLLNSNPEHHAFTCFFNLEGLFLCRNKQLRTFDLKGKPWSRYMLYVRRDSPPGSYIPGVNLLTIPVRSRPFGIADFSTGFRFKSRRFEVEVAYDLWGHGDERAYPRESINSPFLVPCGGLNFFGIAGSGTITVEGQQVAATSSTSCIQRQNPDDPFFIPITDNDIDLDSGAVASALNNMGHIAVGYEGDTVLLGIGIYGEWPQKNSPLATWGAWFKCGASF